MAARPLRRAICAGTKKGASVAPRAIAALRFALPSFRYKRGLGAYHGRVRAILCALFYYAVLLRLVVFALPSSYTARV